MNELLKPRIKVIAPMPLMKNEVGSLLYRHDWNDTFSFGIKTEDAEHFYNQDDFKKWPHIFKELPWWEDREPSDLPEYVIFTLTNDVVPISVKDYKKGKVYIHELKGKYITDYWYLTHAIPATLEEYQSQKQ